MGAIFHNLSLNGKNMNSKKYIYHTKMEVLYDSIVSVCFTYQEIRKELKEKN